MNYKKGFFVVIVLSCALYATSYLYLRHVTSKIEFIEWSVEDASISNTDSGCKIYLFLDASNNLPLSYTIAFDGDLFMATHYSSSKLDDGNYLVNITSKDYLGTMKIMKTEVHKTGSVLPLVITPAPSLIEDITVENQTIESDGQNVRDFFGGEAYVRGKMEISIKLFLIPYNYEFDIEAYPKPN